MIRTRTGRHHRLLAVAASLALTGAVSGCSNGPASVTPLPGALGASHPQQSYAKIGAPRPAPTSIEFFAGITPGAGPRGIALGRNSMWFTEFNAAKIARITTSGVVTEFGGLTPGSSPNNIVLGNDGNYWFTEGAADEICRITPHGKIKHFGVGNEAYGPFDITAGPDGNLWFTFRSPSTNAIGRITLAGAVTLFTAGLSPGDVAVHDITSGPDGALWFTEEFGNRIGRITTSGVITEFSAGISSNAGVADITTGPDGALWFSENGLGQIGRITTSGAVSEFSSGISAGSSVGSITEAKGFVWFTESNAARLGRVSMNGTIKEFAIDGALNSDLLPGAPQGDLWITDLGGNGIVQVTE